MMGLREDTGRFGFGDRLFALCVCTTCGCGRGCGHWNRGRGHRGGVVRRFRDIFWFEVL